jgi:transcriptional regulator with XRE-family HTH domain
MQLNGGSTWSGRQLLISQRLRQRRTALGLTQQQVVGRLAGLGVQTSNRALSSLERGAGIDVAKLPELAAALDCSVTYLIGLTAEPARWEPDPPAPAAARRVASDSASDVAATAPASLIIGAAIPDRVLR